MAVGHHVQTGCRQDASLCYRVAQETLAGAAVTDDKQHAHAADAHGHYRVPGLAFPNPTETAR